MVFLSESMFGIPSPPWVRPLEPSGAITKWVRGVSWESGGHPQLLGDPPAWGAGTAACAEAGPALPRASPTTATAVTANVSRRRERRGWAVPVVPAWGVPAGEVVRMQRPLCESF